MIFFNSSMPRSGSELLQVILHQNPEIYASPTSPLLEYQFGARVNYNLPEVKSQDPRLMQSAFVSMCRGMAKSYYSAITDRSCICDKNRGWLHFYEWVAQWADRPKMICMVRDLRDVFASMEKIYRQSRHRPDGPDNPHAIEGITVFDRIDHWSRSQPIGLAIARLADCFQRSIDSQILFVKYENICSEPENTMQAIYDYLELPMFSHDFKCMKKRVAEDDSYFGTYGNHTVLPVLTAEKCGQWKSILGDLAGQQVFDRYAWFFTTFDYGH